MRSMLPYLDYTHQVKPTRSEGELMTADLMPDLTVEAGVDRALASEIRTYRIHGFCGSTSV